MTFRRGPVPCPAEGQRFGEWTVLSFTGHRGPHRLYRVRCSCGREYERAIHQIRHGLSTKCTECRDNESRRRGKEELSVRLPDGRTLAQIADACGLKLNTVAQRYYRGWPHWKLGVTP